MINDIMKMDEMLMNSLKENDILRERINKAIEYIEQNCIDDEFYINLTRKEKEIIKVLDILKGSDSNG